MRIVLARHSADRMSTMPTLPWVSGPHHASADHTVVVMASRFELSSLTPVPAFMVAAMRVRSQVRRADGAVGVSLVAQPLRRRFYTLSSWRDREALHAMTRAQPHLEVMSQFKASTRDAAFTFWDAPASTRPTWPDAFDRLGREAP